MGSGTLTTRALVRALKQLGFIESPKRRKRTDHKWFFRKTTLAGNVPFVVQTQVDCGLKDVPDCDISHVKRQTQLGSTTNEFLQRIEDIQTKRFRASHYDELMKTKSLEDFRPDR